ncbi:MAG: extracellular solute-binding protein [Candidatus Kapabacteria bacterium]|nr:extracellular solute-binding protein [Candidatus Kapabacteria bacterium]MCS7169767.1 extracellular solute-binding protein [Candidatus Kapabacteria bacterium]MDW7996413.1 extracellular solute-binding protein [Bacteroidota bacterium]MDW8225885.1 extracellular solute-binding protein [Bacteroidota bacterium]
MNRFTTACLALLLTGCPGANPPEEQHLSFWHFWSEPSHRAALYELLREFERRYHCRIEVTELTWNEGKTKLLAAFDAGKPPDVLELGSDWVAQFSSAGVLWSLPPDSIPMQRFVPFSHPPCYWSDTLYAVPWIVDTRVLFINRTALRSTEPSAVPPRTWNKLLQLAERLHRPPTLYGCGVNGADPHRLYKKVLPLIWSFGGDVLAHHGTTTLSHPAVVDAVRFYVRLAQTGLIETQRQLDDAFLQGKLGFWISGAWLAEKLRQQPPTWEYAITPLPGRHPDTPGISFAGGEYLAISAASPRKNLALELVRFLTDGEQAVRFCRAVTEAGFPADQRFLHDSVLLQTPYRRVFAAQLQHARMTPVHPRWLDIEAALENAIVEALYGIRPPEEALLQAQKILSALP